MPAKDALSRRAVLAALGTAGLTTGLPGLAAAAPGRGEPPDLPESRVERSYRIRERAAARRRSAPLPLHRDNGDESAHPDRIGNYAKGLPHDELGRVDREAYDIMVETVSGDEPGDFEGIPLGGPVGLTNPHAAFTHTLVGADSHHLGLRPPPSFASAATAAELVELYWQALCRDIPFAHYDRHPLTIAACHDLSRLTDHTGPTTDRRVTPATLFRATLPGTLRGPYLSQFLLHDVPFGPTTIRQTYRVTTPGDDHMTEYDEWLRVVRGQPPRGENAYDATPRYLRNGRDLAEYSHQNFSYQPYLMAVLLLITRGRDAWDRNNPYLHSKTQPGVTFDWSHPLDVVARVAVAAQKASWFQKWCVHRRLRPEEFAGHVHNHRRGKASYPLHPQLFDSEAPHRVHAGHGSFLLPMAYPEGCPTHPSYTAAHATVAGACATVLKAFYDESYVLPDPVEPSPDGLSLRPYRGQALTIGGELDKLAFNVAYGRNFAGVHWRSDTTAGLHLGEQVAESILTDLRLTLTERFEGFTFTRFDGTTAIV
ncbi:vanadium-dependent haloperoxidase [Saccharothrix sp. S26]|uniref:vanadium-dependent haloperoxidase n=1 Tax=Saccharothrix sp. S26 TaxID=2907215 RepID=UPI001F3B4550|nr:vanadium-dependent haloperoxidase [Saccharothrix sp. S26]MCE6996476.1 vanadium-dependent haloperoxidase [Saccharothrix sp. S26]